MKQQRHHSEQDDRRLGQTRVGSPEPPDAIDALAERAEAPAGDVERSAEDVERGAARSSGGRADGAEAPADAIDEPMKCVWSGYPDYNRDCRSRIPASVVIKAWHREIQLKGTVEGFYYFSWRSGVWLAYGLRDGGCAACIAPRTALIATRVRCATGVLHRRRPRIPRFVALWGRALTARFAQRGWEWR